jgi:RNA 2'-O ribose methyltransferase substrate binding
VLRVLQVDFIYGIAPVLNALSAGRREELLELFVQEGITPRERKDRAALTRIQQLAEAARIPVTFTDKGYLNSLCRNR